MHEGSRISRRQGRGPKKADEPKAQGRRAEEGRDQGRGSQGRGPEAEAPPFVDVATELDEDRKPTIHTGGNVLIKDATILTVTKGTIPKGSILVEKGKIKAVGKDVTAPAGVTVIDATGLVAMPGIIDTHSHIAVQGGVNEGSLSVVPEVRVKDVVTGDDVGDLPGAGRRDDHGSAAARVGQHDRRPGRGRQAPIRQAGPRPDHPRRAAGGEVRPGRERHADRAAAVPQHPDGRRGGDRACLRGGHGPIARRGTRTGRPRERPRASRPDYRPVPPPRVDLRLEALAGILDGSIRIHSHCYRSDEILMLLRTAQKYGVRVQSLQHVLEGYKVAAEIAAHGASASTFSDWWAYKIEAYDAIPYNAALLTEAGANVCIKSDDAELMRHLNLEAAKMVKYGGVTEAQALAMITINPARELGLEDRLGSIEVGKDARHRPVQRPPVRRLLAVRAVADRRRGRTSSGASRAASWSPGPAITRRCPRRPSRCGTASIEIAAQPKGIFALVGRQPPPGHRPRDQGRDARSSPTARSRRSDRPATPIPPMAQTIELGGLDVWPGLVDAGSTLGLFEIGSLSETQDYADAAQFQPELRTSTALHADSEHIPVTRANGILTSFVQPTGGVISGQGCVIDLHGWVPRELVDRRRGGAERDDPDVHRPQSRGSSVRPGRPGPARGRRRGGRPERAAEGAARSRSRSSSARRWPTTPWCEGARQRGEAPPAPDPRLEAMVPYARGEKPVHLPRRAAGRDPRRAGAGPRAEAQGGDLGGGRGVESGRGAPEGQGPRAARRHAPPAAEGPRPV